MVDLIDRKNGSKTQIPYALTGKMAQIDAFTRKRLERFIEEFRASSGQLPTLQDLAKAGFAEELVDRAERAKVLLKLYVTLTNGTIVKGYKFAQD